MDNLENIPEIPRMTKDDFLNLYDEYKDSETLAVNLYIHMPDDSTEIIFNSQGHNKVEYIKNAYDEKLALKTTMKSILLVRNFSLIKSQSLVLILL